MLPLDRSGSGIDRHDRAPAFLRCANTLSLGSAQRRIIRTRIGQATARWRPIRQIGGWMRNRVLREPAMFLPRKDVEKFGEWAVAVRHPIGAAIHARPS